MFVVLAWALNFSVVKLGYSDHWTPPSMMAARCLLQFPFFFILFMAMGLKLSAPRRLWPRLLLSGFLSSGVYMVLFMEGMARIGAAQGAVTLATAPIFISLFSFMAGHDKFTPRWLIGTLLAFSGVVLTHLDGLKAGGGELAGFLIILLSAVVWGVGVLVIRPLVEEIGSVQAMGLTMPGAAIVAIPYGLPAVLSTDYSKMGPVGWGAMAYLVIVAGTLAFVAYYRAIQDLGPARASMTQYVIPPTAALISVVVLGAKLNPLQILGLAVVLGGVFLAQDRRQKPEEGKMDA